VSALRKRLRLLSSEQGYTLVEMITVVGILGTVVTALTGAFVSGTRAEVDLESRFQAQNDAVVALDRIRRDVHCASSATASSASSITLAVPCVPSGVVKWCTVGSAARFTIRRLPSNGACDASSAKFADYLTTGSVFAYEPQSINNLPRLRVELPVRLGEMTASYRLCDILVMRNGTRTGAPQPAVAPC
jgi:prepilin-type N-terminal cleavage/methylation domain-containing protein